MEQVRLVPTKLLTKIQRVALITFLYNLSTVALSTKLDTSFSVRHLNFIKNIVAQETEDGEVAYRAAMALGNTICALLRNGSTVQDKSALKDLVCDSMRRFDEDRLQTVGTEILAML